MGLALLWAVLSVVGMWLLGMTVGKAILGGLIGVGLHVLGGLLHQMGHAWAARRTGHPMTGIRLWSVLEASVYPPDEPALPPSVHIRRALGGPEGSLVVSVVAGFIALAVLLAGREGGLLWWLAVFFFLDNLLVFTIGSLLPLGFTDGSTIMHYWRAGRATREP
jgi:hypothetical protein